MNKKYTIFDLYIVIFLSVLIGVVLGFLFNYVKLNYNYDKNLFKIVSMYNKLIDNYYNDVDAKKITDGAISGMLSSLNDPYSNYLQKNQNKINNTNINGSYEGIGITIGKINNEIVILDVLENSSAKKKGILANDIILKVNNIDVGKKSVFEVVSIIEKDKDKKIKLKVKRNDKNYNFILKKENIELFSVEKDILDKNIGYLKVSRFSFNTFKQFKNEIKNLEKKKIKSLVIDLRNNPGGSLDQVDDMLDIFLKEKILIYQVKSKNKLEKIYTKNKDYKKYNIVIIINENTASAAEIFASGMKDNYKRVKVIGKQSYGKGTVQQEFLLKDGSSFKYTTEKWLTSKGVWYNNKKGGLVPDIEVDFNKELDKAIELLKKE